MSQPPSNLDGLRIQREDAPRPRSAKLIAVAVLLLLALAAAAWWWLTQSAAVEVRTALAQELGGNANDRTVLNASGYVTARRAATVSSKVTGKVNEVLVEEGMKVAEGQVLARLDDTNVRTSLELAQAQAAAAQAALEETRVRLAEAEQELKRQTDLRRGNVAAQSDFDHAEAAARAFRARLEQQQAEAAVAERTVAVWWQQHDDTIIRAPFAGTVTSKNAQPGEMISPMSTGGFTRTGICTLVDMQSLEIEIDVNESYINRVEPEQSVEATLDAYPEWKIPCHVTAIIPTADRNKSTVRVRVGFDRLDPRILPDMGVKVAFREAAVAGAAPTHRGVVVPKAAILQEGSQNVAYVIKGEHAERRAIAVGRTDGDNVVVTAGISPTERVVVSASKPLTDGIPLKETTP
jgi:HlyD family secretion protein